MVVTPRLLSIALAAAGVWTAPILLAQAPQPAGSTDLRALTTEFTSRGGAGGRSFGYYQLPTATETGG